MSSSFYPFMSDVAWKLISEDIKINLKVYNKIINLLKSAHSIINIIIFQL